MVGPLILAVICGAVSGRLVYSIYLNNNDFSSLDDIIYLIQVGAYSSYDNMKANTLSNNYVYYEDDGLYKAIIGMTKNKNNIDKITATYSGDTLITEYYSDDKDLNEKIDSYDERINNTSTTDEVKSIILEMLRYYKEDDDLKLIKVD